MGDTRPDRADVKTVDYFDSHAHHYSNQRIKGVASIISHRVTPDSTVCDVGAGGGGDPSASSQGVAAQAA